MEGKLRKRDEHYFFWSSDWNPDKEEGFVANTTNLLPTKLSIKNCQSIENGYDLDELASKTYREFPTDELQHYNRDTQCFKKRKAFIKGFQKALEILGDKKFSENDMRRALSAGLSIGYGRQFEIENKQVEIDSYIKSLQQTEWDVEIEMEPYAVCDFEDFINDGKTHIIETKLRPRLDADGCLILRRK